jgi:tetratricopeptide (TPR) repeat protein
MTLPTVEREKIVQTKAAKNPNQAKLEEAIALQSAGDTKKASALFLQVLKAQPDNVFALYSLAAIESNAGNQKVAINYANRAASLNPGFAQVRLARSVILYKLGQFQEALSEVEHALQLQPDLLGAQAHKDAVILASNAGAQPTSVASAPASPKNQIALQLQAQGELEEAAKIFLDVIAEDPNDFIALYSLGVIARRMAG